MSQIIAICPPKVFCKSTKYVQIESIQQILEKGFLYPIYAGIVQTGAAQAENGLFINIV